MSRLADALLSSLRSDGENRLARFVSAVESGEPPDGSDLAALAEAFRAYLDAHNLPAQKRRILLINELGLKKDSGRPTAAHKSFENAYRVEELRLRGIKNPVATVAKEQGLTRRAVRNHVQESPAAKQLARMWTPFRKIKDLLKSAKNPENN